MAKLAPCGTFTAYKRHKRNDEPVDDECAQAARDQHNSRTESSRKKSADEVDRATGASYAEMTRAEVLKDLQVRLFQQMDAAAPQNVSSIAAQLRLVAAELDEVSGDRAQVQESPSSVLDEVSRMRSRKAQ